MSKKIHMQDQVFNNVEQIMNHFQRRPLKFLSASLHLRLPMADYKADRFKPMLKASH